MKIVLLGLSGTGKTTIGDFLKQHYNFPIVEVDDDVVQRCNGHWPEEETLIHRSVSKKEIIEHQSCKINTPM